MKLSFTTVRKCPERVVQALITQKGSNMLLWMSAGSPKELLKAMMRYDRGFQITVGFTVVVLIGAGMVTWQYATKSIPPAIAAEASASASWSPAVPENSGIECHSSGQAGLAACHVLVLKENGKQEDLLLLCGEHPPGPYGQPGGPGCRIVSSP